MDVKIPVFGSIKITAGPAVFECGNCYAVVWSTNFKGSGCVKIGNKIYWDAKSGVIKTHENVHVVKVEKDELKNKKYKVISKRVFYKFGYDSVIGKTVESEEIRFNGCAPSDEMNILCISDVHDMAKEMYQSLTYFKKDADLIMLIGDISSEVEYKKRYIYGILDLAAKVSKGKTPVVYARGNHETRGEFASQILEYFPHSTGEFYFPFDFGELSAIVLDPGEDKEDNHPEYSGLVDFASYRDQQYKWLCSLDKTIFPGKYRIVFSHEPRLENHFGKDWTEPLKRLGAQLIVGGHLHVSDFIDGDLPIYVECGKRGKSGEFAAAMITLQSSKIHMQTINNNGETILKNEITV